MRSNPSTQSRSRFLRNRIGHALADVFTFGCLGRPVREALWLEIAFTGRDLWTVAEEDASLTRRDQAAPRRHSVVDARHGHQARQGTYGGEAGARLGLGRWLQGAGHGFAFRQLNLCGAHTPGAMAWGEKYISVGGPAPDYGFGSWRILRAPAGWLGEIVRGGDPWSIDGQHAFPVWRAAAGPALSPAKREDPEFTFRFQVLVGNPASAFESDRRLRVWFGGYDLRPDAGGRVHELAGVMTLVPTVVGPTAHAPAAAQRPRAGKPSAGQPRPETGLLTAGTLSKVLS